MQTQVVTFRDGSQAVRVGSTLTSTGLINNTLLPMNKLEEWNKLTPEEAVREFGFYLTEREIAYNT